ncbi:hypothetical protein GJ496_008766 [Pomphorhynchus laevis]|nr:hypothetical protein GJ496_008766 [Pomphorhynchus laevis]
MRAYCALINGYSICGLYDKAIQVYQDLNVQTITCKYTLQNLIRSTAGLSGEHALHTLHKLLNDHNDIKPDSNMFSSIFFAIKELCTKNRQLRPILLRLTSDCIAEMSSINVDHSLGTLNNIIGILKATGNLIDLPVVITWAEQVCMSPDFTIRHVDDCVFFDNAMFAAFVMGNYKIAKQLFVLLSSVRQSEFLLFPSEHTLRRFYTRLISLSINYCADHIEVERLWLSIIPVSIQPTEDLLLQFMDFIINFQLIDNENNWPTHLFNIISQTRMYRRGLSSLGKLFYILRCNESDSPLQSEIQVCRAAVSLFLEDDNLIDESNQHQFETVFNDLVYLLARNRLLAEACKLIGSLPQVIFDRTTLDSLLCLYIEVNHKSYNLTDITNILKAYARLDKIQLDEAIDRVLGQLVLSKKDQSIILSISQKLQS